MTITRDGNIADIQTILSTRPGLRSLKIFVDIDQMGFFPGLLPAAFDSRTLYQDFEELIIVLEGRVIYPNAPPLSSTCNRKSRTPKAMFPLIPYLSCFILIVSLLAIQAFKGFRKFISLGPGGTPPNIFGYAKIVFFQVFKPSKPAPTSVTGIGYLPALEPRLLPPPTVARIAPQRQTAQEIGQDVQDELWGHLGALGPDFVIAPSILENHSEGLFYRDKEVVHVHRSDGSLHVYLSALDCKTAIESQWGGM